VIRHPDHPDQRANGPHTDGLPCARTRVEAVQPDGAERVRGYEGEVRDTGRSMPAPVRVPSAREVLSQPDPERGHADRVTDRSTSNPESPVRATRSFELDVSPSRFSLGDPSGSFGAGSRPMAAAQPVGDA
jgi:hypothetical protein